MNNTYSLTTAQYYTLNPLAGTNIDRHNLALCRAKLQLAQEAAAGGKVSPNSNTVKVYKSLLPNVLPLTLFSTLLGHMLGDCAVKYDAPKDQASITFEWGNLAYATSVYNKLYDYVLSPPRVQVRTNAKGNKVTTYCFQTVTLPLFAIFYHLFIMKGKKTVCPGLICNLVTPLSLAVWFIDDGNQTDYRLGHGQGVQLNTQGFTVDTVAQMVKELNDKFGFNCWMRILNNKGGKPIIVIPSKSYPKFYNLVKEHMHVSMMYKLPAIK